MGERGRLLAGYGGISATHVCIARAAARSPPTHINLQRCTQRRDCCGSQRKKVGKASWRPFAPFDKESAIASRGFGDDLATDACSSGHKKVFF